MYLIHPSLGIEVLRGVRETYQEEVCKQDLKCFVWKLSDA